jgi:hypothetical protein
MRAKKGAMCVCRYLYPVPVHRLSTAQGLVARLSGSVRCTSTATTTIWPDSSLTRLYLVSGTPERRFLKLLKHKALDLEIHERLRQTQSKSMQKKSVSLRSDRSDHQCQSCNVLGGFQFHDKWWQFYYLSESKHWQSCECYDKHKWYVTF